jgi:hypothetical protein
MRILVPHQLMGVGDPRMRITAPTSADDGGVALIGLSSLVFTSNINPDLEYLNKESYDVSRSGVQNRSRVHVEYKVLPRNKLFLEEDCWFECWQT